MPERASPASASGTAPPRTPPSCAAASNSFAVLRRITSRYCSSETRVLWLFRSCSTSPSAMVLVASASTSITRILRRPTIIWNAREYRKSPTSTLAALPNSAFAVLRPRRSVDELDHGGELVVIAAAVAERPGGEQHQRRPQALAAAADDVLGDRSDQDDVGIEPLPDQRVDRLHVGGDQPLDRFEGHSGESRGGRFGGGGREYYMPFDRPV